MFLWTIWGVIISIGKLIFHGNIHLGEALVLKRTSCSVGNFAAQFLNVVFKSEELANRYSTGSSSTMFQPG